MSPTDLTVEQLACDLEVADLLEPRFEPRTAFGCRQLTQVERRETGRIDTRPASDAGDRADAPSHPRRSRSAVGAALGPSGTCRGSQPPSTGNRVVVVMAPSNPIVSAS